MNKYKYVLTILSVVLLFGLVSCSNPVENEDSDNMEQASNEVAMENTAFNPQELTVEVGTTVTWTNEDGFAHTVTSGTPDNPTDLFDSGNVASGDTFEFTFEETGTYEYYCKLHTPDMTGTIVVNESGSSSGNMSDSDNGSDDYTY